MNFPEFVITAAVAFVAVAAAIMIFFTGYAAGSRRHQARVVDEATRGLTQLWRYQRLLNDSAHEVDGLVQGVSPITETSRDELLAAREAAYPHVDRLPREARWVVEAPALPDIADPAVDLDDIVVAYTHMAETIRVALERRAEQRLPARARRAVMARVPHSHDRVA